MTVSKNVFKTNKNISIANGTYNAKIGDDILADATAGQVTVVLPDVSGLSLTGGHSIAVTIKDFANKFNINNLVIDSNGGKIKGVTGNKILAVQGADLKLVYSDAARGWLSNMALSNPAAPGYTVDANTLLYIKGVSDIVDISNYNRTFTNNGVTILNDSMYFNNKALTLTPGITFSSPYTIEFNLKTNVLTTGVIFHSGYNSYLTTDGSGLGGSGNDGKLAACKYSGNDLVSSSLLGNGVFSHCAIVSDATNARMYFNGHLVGTGALAAFGVLTIGSGYHSSYMNLKHLRVSDIARYTSDFTPLSL